MRTNIPPKVRFAVYLITGIGSVAVSYMVAKNMIGDAELTAWTALVGLVNGMAASNTNITDAK